MWRWWLLALALPACVAADRTGKDEIPEAVFAPWDGIWKGTFEVLDGEEILTRLDVVQKYYSDRPDLQHGRFRERDQATGDVVTARAVNRREGDALICEVQKSTGERVVHRGRWTGRGIEWSRRTDRVEEVFREEVKTDANGYTVYVIDGYGRYDGGPRLTFRGRYRKVGSKEEARFTADGTDYPSR
jgi:hypothetical protein